jgi:hypothetical protein
VVAHGLVIVVILRYASVSRLRGDIEVASGEKRLRRILTATPPPPLFSQVLILKVDKVV